jgi:hypothetical protein
VIKTALSSRHSGMQSVALVQVLVQFVVQVFRPAVFDSSPQNEKASVAAGLVSAPRPIRTDDLRIRSPLLYPAELGARGASPRARAGIGIEAGPPPVKPSAAQRRWAGSSGADSSRAARSRGPAAARPRGPFRSSCARTSPAAARRRARFLRPRHAACGRASQSPSGLASVARPCRAPPRSRRPQPQRG